MVIHWPELDEDLGIAGTPGGLTFADCHDPSSINVVLVHARTHTPCRRDVTQVAVARFFFSHDGRWLWVPRFRGDDRLIWVGSDRAAYCTLSATNRNSPSALETSSRTDFLPSFFN
jgi:hypothetical protein